MEMRKTRKQNQKNARDGKTNRVHRDLGLPNFGAEKRKLEARVPIVGYNCDYLEQIDERTYE